VIRDVPLGALLIQSDPHTGEPLLLNCTLPEKLHARETAEKAQVLLLDSQMGTGAAAREYKKLANGVVGKVMLVLVWGTDNAVVLSNESTCRFVSRVLPDALSSRRPFTHMAHIPRSFTFPSSPLQHANHAVMAVRVLLDHGVPGECLLFCAEFSVPCLVGSTSLLSCGCMAWELDLDFCLLCHLLPFP